MGLFRNLCRNTGLMVHHIVQPMREEKERAGKAGSPASQHRRELNRTVEEKQVSPTTTLRRTTIEEIEVKEGERGK